MNFLQKQKHRREAWKMLKEDFGVDKSDEATYIAAKRLVEEKALDPMFQKILANERERRKNFLFQNFSIEEVNEIWERIRRRQL